MLVAVLEAAVINQAVTLKLLAKLGCQADIAQNGVVALEALEQHKYKAVLMDCQMPVMDGFETTREIRRRGDGIASTVVIAMTANAFAEDRERCRAAGMDDYLSKPVGLERLAAILNRWTGSGAGIEPAAAPRASQD